MSRIDGIETDLFETLKDIINELKIMEKQQKNLDKRIKKLEAKNH